MTFWINREVSKRYFTQKHLSIQPGWFLQMMVDSWRLEIGWLISRKLKSSVQTACKGTVKEGFGKGSKPIIQSQLPLPELKIFCIPWVTLSTVHWGEWDERTHHNVMDEEVGVLSDRFFKLKSFYCSSQGWQCSLCIARQIWNDVVKKTKWLTVSQYLCKGSGIIWLVQHLFRQVRVVHKHNGVLISDPNRETGMISFDYGDTFTFCPVFSIVHGCSHDRWSYVKNEKRDKIEILKSKSYGDSE